MKLFVCTRCGADLTETEGAQK